MKVNLLNDQIAITPIFSKKGNRCPDSLPSNVNDFHQSIVNLTDLK